MWEYPIHPRLTPPPRPTFFSYSPDGKLYQVEYAYKVRVRVQRAPHPERPSLPPSPPPPPPQAIEGGGTAIGVRCRDGIVFGAERLVPSKLLVPHATAGRRIALLDEHIAGVSAGLVPDARRLVSKGREDAAEYRSAYGEPIPPRTLNERLGSYLHAFTVYWSARVSGAALIFGGYDAATGAHELYAVEPNGSAVRYHGCALGKGARPAKTEIEKAKFEGRSAEEALGLVAKMCAPGGGGGHGDPPVLPAPHPTHPPTLPTTQPVQGARRHKGQTV